MSFGPFPNDPGLPIQADQLPATVATASSIWLPDYPQHYGVVGDGTTDDAAGFLAACAACAASGRKLRVPWTPGGYAFGSTVLLPSNLTLEHSEGVTYKTLLPESSNPAVFQLGTSGPTDTSWSTNVHIGGGRAYIDMTGLIDDTGQATGINVSNCSDFSIENITGIALPQPAGNVINLIRNRAGAQPGAGTVYGPRRFVIRGIRNTTVRGDGSSCIQVSSAQDGRIEDCWADGACAVRVESHKSSISTLNGLVENLVIDGVAVDPTSTAGDKTTADAIANPPDAGGHWSGSAAAYLLPHDACIVQNITVRNIRATAGTSGCYVSFNYKTDGTGATLADCTVERMNVTGGGKGIKFPSGVAQRPQRMSYRDCHVDGAAVNATFGYVGNGHDYSGGDWHGCSATNCAESGWRPTTESTSNPQGKFARLYGCRASGNALCGATINNHERVEFYGGNFGDDPAGALVQPYGVKFSGGTAAAALLVGLDINYNLTGRVGGSPAVGLLQEVSPNSYGTLAARPSAATVPDGYEYFATDDIGGRMSQVQGGAWHPVGLGLSASIISTSNIVAPGALWDVVATVDPRLCTGSGAVSAVNAWRLGRVVCHRAGVLHDFAIYPVVSSGNICVAIYDTGATTPAVRTRLWTSGSIACPSAISASAAPIVGDPALTVAAGDELDFLIAADNTTATFLRALAGASFSFPAGYLAAASALAKPIASGTSGMPAPTTLAEASLSIASTLIAMTCRIA